MYKVEQYEDIEYGLMMWRVIYRDFATDKVRYIVHDFHTEQDAAKVEEMLNLDTKVVVWTSLFSDRTDSQVLSELANRGYEIKHIHIEVPTDDYHQYVRYLLVKGN